MTGRTRRGHAPFSIRIPLELRTHVKKMAADRMMAEGAYLCMLIENDMAKRPRRAGKQHVMWRQELAEILKAIIACGNKVNSSQRDRRDFPETDGQRIIDELVKAVTAVLQLEDAVRRK
jgi:hypothetical protein